MKKFVSIMLCLLLVVAMVPAAFADGPEVITPDQASHMFVDEVITSAIDVLGALLSTVLTIFGAWVLAKLGQSVKTKNIKDASEELIKNAIQTVGELQQKCVNDWKAANADNKLTAEEIAQLKKELVDMTLTKTAQPVIDLLRAAKVDLVALILGAGDDLINAKHEKDK